MKYLIIFFTYIQLASCIQLVRKFDEAKTNNDTTTNVNRDTASSKITIYSTAPADVVKYAETLIGTPYLYGSTDPQLGFDCSGFITYVFNHFNINVPRSSAEFTNAAPEVFIKDSKPGDLILFTGTDSSEHTVGHMGIIISNDSIQTLFIHSTSGKANGVTITPLNNYYMSRFVKVIRIFKENNQQ